MVRFAVIFCILTCLISTTVNASAQIQQAHEQYYFRTLNISDGLLSALPHVVFQHSSGFIWIGTDKGLSRYDGENFVHYTFAAKPPFHISNNFILNIAEDADRNLWVATEDGINKIAPDGEVTIYNTGLINSPGLDTSWFSTIFIDSQNRIWIGANQALYLYQEAEQRFVKFKSQDSNARTVEAIVEMPNGDIYLSESDGLSKVDFESQSYGFVLDQSGNKVIDDYTYSLVVADESHVWIGSETQGAVKINVTTRQIVDSLNTRTQPALVSDVVDVLFQDSEGKLWIGNWRKGVSIFNPLTRQTSEVRAADFEESVLPSNTVRNITQDAAGLVWLGTEEGIAIHSPASSYTRRFYKKADNSGLVDNWVFDVDVDHEGSVWIATEKGINTIDLSTGEVTQKVLLDRNDKPIQTLEIWNIAQKSEHEFYIATVSGLKIYNKITKRVTHVSADETQVNEEIFTVNHQAIGGTWITGYSNVGLQHISADGKVVDEYLNTEDSRYWTGGNFTIAKVVSKSGALVLATTDNIFIVDPVSKQAKYLNISQTGSNIRTTGIVEGHRNEFWITTQAEGLIKLVLDEHFDNPRIAYFNDSTGFPFEELNGVVYDEGILWLSARQSVIKFDTRDNHYLVFDNLLPLSSYNFNESTLQKHANDLIVGSSKGVLVIDTLALKLSQYQPKIQIADIYNGDAQIRFDRKEQGAYRFSQDNNNLEFHFASLDYSNSGGNLYRYRLKGVDSKWSKPTLKNSVRYLPLFPGNYVFEVQGTNSSGVWSEHTASFHFTITFAWWFYTLVLAIALLLIAAVVYSYKRREFYITLRKQAHEDSLTGLQNRFSYSEQVDERIAAEESFSILLIDLDGFKDINDGYGHLVGDAFLAKIAKKITASVGRKDIACRLGGDEFAIIMTTVDREQVAKVADAIRRALSRPIKTKAHTLLVSASIGVVMHPVHARTSAALFGCVDAAMYAAKRSGKNAVYFYDEKLGNEISQKIQLRRNLKNAINNNEMQLHYQPKVNQITDEIVGVEALLRWFHPEQGFISPAVFIPEAERDGTIVQIGDWVIRQACIDAKILRDSGREDFRIAINLSPLQLMRHHFLDYVDSVINETGVDPNNLEFEITESMLIESPEQCQQILSELQLKGATIALDDFGAGYSSLAYLAQYNIDTLKIDRSLFVDIETNKRNQKILKNIYSLAFDLDLVVVAEGIETQQQLDILKRYKGDIIQGFVFYRPLSFDDVYHLFESTVV